MQERAPVTAEAEDAAHDRGYGSAQRLDATVIEGGYCIGCGVCCAGREPAFRIGFDGEGFLQAKLQPGARADDTRDYEAACPFSATARNENEIAHDLFGDACARDGRIGHYLSLHAGHIADESLREFGSSGGLTTWVLERLLAENHVDRIVHVQPAASGADAASGLFHYAISTNAEELRRGKRSHYYPIELSGVLDEVRRTPGRTAFVAIPCFAKAIRLAAENDPVLRQRVSVVMGLVCGHLKSRFFAEYLGWLVGVAPSGLTAMNFRKKLPGRSASQYTVEARDAAATTRSGRPVEDYFGTSWDLGFFKYKACDFCDDVFAETADIVMGDAWIEPYAGDWRGTNIVVTRRTDLRAMLSAGEARGEIVLDDLGVAPMVESQAAGLRHRREGLAERLGDADRSGAWRPPKRSTEQRTGLDGRRRYVYRARGRLAARSAAAFRRARPMRGAGLHAFYAVMSIPVFVYFARRESLKRAVRETAPYKWLKRTLRSAGDA